jgi:hypothetical protein
MGCGTSGGCLTPRYPDYARRGATEIAQTIVDTGLDVLADFLCEDDDCQLVGRVSHSQPVVEPANLVASWIAEIGLAPINNPAAMVLIPKVLIRNQVHILCWPMQMQPASNEELDIIAQSLSILGESWYLGVLKRLRREHPAVCKTWAPSRLMPIAPLGGVAGWQFDITVNIDDDCG